MSVDVPEKTQPKTHPTTEPSHATRGKTAPPPHPKPSLMERIRSVDMHRVEWSLTLMIAFVMAASWCTIFFAQGWLQFMAGIIPVAAGLYLGSRIKEQAMLHGIVMGIVGFLFGLGFMGIYAILVATHIVPLPVIQVDPNQPPLITQPFDLVTIYMSFSFFALIPFPAFGTVMSYRNMQRQHEMDAHVAVRGGKLERYTTIRTLEDVQGLPLAQFGSYVRHVFCEKPNRFTFKDYHFTEKDKYLDLELEYDNERYLVRLSVADQVRTGTIESLVQDMRKRGFPKGMVITSTEFTSEVTKSAKSRKHIVLIDGKTLYTMAEH